MPGYDVFFKEIELTEEEVIRMAEAMDHIEPKRPSIPENVYEEGIAWLKENAYRLRKD